MPIRRSVKQRPDGTYRVTIPKSWVENAEKAAGRKVVAVNMEVDGELIISPVFEEEGGEE